MKKLFCVLVSLFVLVVPSFAGVAPVPITVYGGLSAGIASGTNFGVNAVFSLPMIAGVGLEYESSSAAAEGVSFSSVRTGFIFKVLGLNVSTGSETLTPSGTLSIGGTSFGGASMTGTYLGVGPEFGLFGVTANAKLIVSTFSAGAIPTAQLNLGYTF